MKREIKERKDLTIFWDNENKEYRLGREVNRKKNTN